MNISPKSAGLFDILLNLLLIDNCIYSRMSGLSPFAGDDNQETCSNVTKAIWDFDDAAFETISPEAKDFISKLMVRNSRYS